LDVIYERPLKLVFIFYKKKTNSEKKNYPLGFIIVHANNKLLISLLIQLLKYGDKCVSVLYESVSNKQLISKFWVGIFVYFGKMSEIFAAIIVFFVFFLLFCSCTLCLWSFVNILVSVKKRLRRANGNNTWLFL